MPSAFWLPSCRKRRRKRSIRLTCGGLRAAAFLCLPLFRRKTSPCFPPASLLFSAPYRTLPPAYAPPTDRFLRRISARRPAAEKQGCPSLPGRLHALPHTAPEKGLPAIRTPRGISRKHAVFRPDAPEVRPADGPALSLPRPDGQNDRGLHRHVRHFPCAADRACTLLFCCRRPPQTGFRHTKSPCFPSLSPAR